MMDIRPIVVNGDMVTLGGNMRLRACREAGMKEVPVIVLEGLDEKQEKEFIIKDNVGYGEWDWEMLANEWDSNKLEEWGLDIPVFAEENDMNDLSDKIKNDFRIEIILKSEEEQEKTYNELIEQMITVFKKVRENNQYDEFLHKIQQQKMKELWDNKEDEVWDNV